MDKQVSSGFHSLSEKYAANRILPNRICTILPPSFQKKITEGFWIRIISVVMLSALASCQPATIGVQSQRNEAKTTSPGHTANSPASTTHALTLRQIRKWNLFDINDITWSMDSYLFAVAGKENDDEAFGVFAYNIDSSDKLWSRETYVPFSLVFSPDSQYIAIPFFAGFYLIEPLTGQIDKELLYQEGYCFGGMGISFSPDGTKIYTLSTSPEVGREISEIYMWDLETDRCLGEIVKEDGTAFDFEFSQDGMFMVLGLRTIKERIPQEVHLWDLGAGRLLCSFSGMNPTIDPGGAVMATANVDNPGEVDLWDTKSCELLVRLSRKDRLVPLDIAFSPDGELLAVGGETVQIWGVRSRRLLFESDRLSNSVHMIAFSPDSDLILTVIPRLSGNDRGEVILWGVTH